MSVVACPLRVAAYLAPEQVGLVQGSQRWTFTQWDEAVNRLCLCLKERGLVAGDRVGFVVHNSAEAMLVFLALWRLGVATCLVNWRWSHEQIQNVRADVPCRFWWGDEDVLRLVQDSAAYMKDDVGCPMDDTDVATILFTSGSTGQSKGVVHNLRNHYFSALGVNEHLRFEQGCGWALTLPLHHVGGLAVLFRCLFARATCVVPTAQESLNDLIAHPEVTHVSLVPTQLYRIMKEDQQQHLARWQKLSVIVVGGGPISAELLKRAREYALPVHPSYGLTEMGSLVAATEKNVCEELVFHSGTVAYHREMHIDDHGELCVKGDPLFRGYWQKGQWERPLDAEGWYHTGDLGELGPNDELTIKGRKDLMFVCGGENIYPEEIELCLLDINDIEQAVVVSKKDAEFGERPVAFVRTASSFGADDEARWRKQLSQRLARFKMPVAFFSWPISISVEDKSAREQLRHLV